MKGINLIRVSGWFSSTKAEPEERKTQIAEFCINLEQQATVIETVYLGQRGRVSYQATTWFAICVHPTVLLPNAPVRVVGFYNATTLIVEPIGAVAAQFLPSTHNAA